MALSFLGGLCFAVAHLPAIAAKQVNVTVNPTTGYFESGPRTIRVPPTVTMSPIKDVSTVVVEKMSGGGLAQPISSGIEITALKQSAPVGVKLRMGLNAVKGAATRCFTSLRCNMALSAGASGLQALLDGVDWVMVEGGKIQRVETTPSTPEDGGGMWCVRAVEYCSGSPLGVVANLNARGPSDWQWPYKYDGQGSSTVAYFTNKQGVRGTISRNVNISCGAPYSFNADYHCVRTSEQPVSEAEIADTVNSSYSPDPSDLPWLSPGIDLSAADVELDITDPPSFKEPVGTKTIYDAAGNPVEVQDTNIWHDFAPVDNPGKEPGLKDVETQKTDRYGPGGEPLGSTTTVVTRPPASPGVPPTESPVDCDLMPTLCKWFDWTQDGWEHPDEPDFEGLRQVIDLREYDESVVIGPGLMACPEPLALYVPYLDVEVGISYQPFCDLADLLNPLLIALAYFGGAVLLVRSI